MTRNYLIAWLAGTLLLSGMIAWQTGFAPSVHDLEDLLRATVDVPLWMLCVLCAFPSGVAVRCVRALAHSRNRRVAWPEAGLASEPVAALELSECPADGTPASAPVAPAAPIHPHPRDPLGDYQEDAAFGVIWRWYEDPLASELLACCPACNDLLVPLRNGGGLSRGLHCERCNKLRAAGEHPDEVHQKVQQLLAERARSGEWRGAPGRVERARSRATRPLVEMPAA